jgi:hypothetical protein
VEVGFVTTFSGVSLGLQPARTMKLPMISIPGIRMAVEC